MAVHTTVRLSLWQRYVARFGGAAVTLVLGIVTYAALQRAHEARLLTGHTRAVIEATTKTLSELQDAETGQRGYLLTGRDDYLAPFHAALANITQDTLELRRLTADDVTQNSRVDSLDSAVRDKLAELQETIDLRRDRGSDAAVGVVRDNRGKRSMDRIRAILGNMAAHEQARLDTRERDEDQRRLWLIAILIGGTITAALIALMVNGIMERYALGQQQAATTLSAANAQLQEQAVELEAQNEQLQQQAVELEAQAGSLEEQATELESANDELQTSAQALTERTLEAERASAAKSEFLAAMSHELRTPLNAITGYAELVAIGVRGPVSEAQSQDLARIKKSASHLLALINEILNLARVESGQVEFRSVQVNVAPLLDDVAALVAPQMRAKGLTLTVTPCEEGLEVETDPERVQQILLNLLTNACKFTPRDGVVSMVCEPSQGNGDGAMVNIRVRDSGRGIPRDKLKTIFEPFVQIDRRLTPDGEQGLGLGLAISRDLARAMGGDLSVESTVGEGSTFTLTLPVHAFRA